MLGYNGQLYNSVSSSLRSPNGGVGIAVLVQLGEKTNPELEKIIKAASSLKYAGSSTSLSSVSLSSLVSTTSHMITYEGSLTQPGCQVAGIQTVREDIVMLQESVTWIIPNKPIYVQAEHMMLLSNLMQGTEDDPRAPLAGNLRPIQQTHGRMVRTNIHFDNNQVIYTLIMIRKQAGAELCQAQVWYGMVGLVWFPKQYNVPLILFRVNGWMDGWLDRNSDNRANSVPAKLELD